MAVTVHSYEADVLQTADQLKEDVQVGNGKMCREKMGRCAGRKWEDVQVENWKMYR